MANVQALAEAANLEEQERALELRRRPLEEQLAAVRAITSEPERQHVEELRQAIRAAKAEAEAAFSDPLNAARRVVAELRERQRRYVDPLAAAYRRSGELLGAYATEQRRKAQELQRKREAEARARAEAERREREEAALAEAQRLADAGQEEAAQEVIDAAADEPVAPVVLPPTPVAQPETSYAVVERWDYEILDAAKLGPAYVKLVPVKSAIRAAVNAHHERAAEMVGDGAIRVFKVAGARG